MQINIAAPLELTYERDKMRQLIQHITTIQMYAFEKKVTDCLDLEY